VRQIGQTRFQRGLVVTADQQQTVGIETLIGLDQLYNRTRCAPWFRPCAQHLDANLDSAAPRRMW